MSTGTTVVHGRSFAALAFLAVAAACGDSGSTPPLAFGDECERGASGEAEACAAPLFCADEGALAGTCVECVSTCPAGMVCDGGRCVEPVPECTGDEDCAGERVCEEGVCVDATPECTDDPDCGAGRLCQGGRCVDDPGCTSDDECGRTEICEAGDCIAASVGTRYVRTLVPWSEAWCACWRQLRFDDEAECRARFAPSDLVECGAESIDAVPGWAPSAECGIGVQRAAIECLERRGCGGVTACTNEQSAASVRCPPLSEDAVAAYEAAMAECLSRPE